MTESPAASRKPLAPGEEGVALMAVMIFALIVGIGGLAFFSMASYEFKSAQDSQHSSEAFNLADGATERARGELLINKNWRGPITTTAMGSGTYHVTVTDTLIGGNPGVLLHAEGFVGDGARGVEVTGEVKDLLETVAIHASGNFHANGNLNVDGHIHVNGDGDFGPEDDHLKSGTYDEGFAVKPPAVSTDPEDFPDATFYRVVIKSPGGNLYGEVHVYDRTSGNFKKVPGAPNISVTESAPNEYEYNFNNNDTKTLFNYDPLAPGAVFTRQPGDSSVVVDFGHPDDASNAIANIDFASNDETFRFETTIINTRFEGIDEGDNRIEPCSGYWVGGNVTFGNKMTWAPRNCVALITNVLGPPVGQQPNAQGKLGTVDNPALTYVTGTVQGIKGQLQVHGILISLCDIFSQGGPDVFHHPEIKDCVPGDVLSEGSGFFQAREWREVGL